MATMLAQTSFKFYSFIFLFMVFFHHCTCDVVQLDKNNVDVILNNNQLVFVNFYADWCRFSRMLAPIFEEGSNLVKKDYPDPGMVVFAKVDCDSQPDIAQKYHVNKYPTMKLFRGGQLVKREYRGQRSAENLADFIRQQLKDPIKEFQSLDEIYELQRDKRTIIGYFTTKDSLEYNVFARVAKLLKDDCQFYVGFGEASKAERTTGDNIIFKPIGETNPDMVYLGSLANEDLLKQWSQDKCVPLVREITFANGEELTEEGLPFLILFHNKEDTESMEKYSAEVSRLVSFKSSINFLFADCETFSHPLHHLGKTVKDCPLVAIDSFKHMYLFPKFEDISQPGKLKQFILDLHSGKLHREFHHGPDQPAATTAPPAPKVGFHAQLPKEVVEKAKVVHTQKQILIKSKDAINTVVTLEPGKKPSAIPTIKGSIKIKAPGMNEPIEVVSKSAPVKETTPPEETSIESIFVKMKPSEHRYTILDRDEL
uniref:Endoplasmic reticulum resident protein 44-like n=1 Tax=Phallusia mammillata TaxID=59560 RepID=A0A6F9DBL9_9ASCI|nr:endoplasmic reticulum resident protein 44-like [Phallusia mammillata]